MKTGEGYACDKCHLVITADEEKRGEVLHYGKVDYHCSCWVNFLRSKGAIPQERKAS